MRLRLKKMRQILKILIDLLFGRMRRNLLGLFVKSNIDQQKKNQNQSSDGLNSRSSLPNINIHNSSKYFSSLTVNNKNRIPNQPADKFIDNPDSALSQDLLRKFSIKYTLPKLFQIVKPLWREILAIFIIFNLLLGSFPSYPRLGTSAQTKEQTLTILNPYSHPGVGGDWVVEFETTPHQAVQGTAGKADLIISPEDQATIDDLGKELLTTEVKIEKDGNGHNTNNGASPGTKHNVIDNLHNQSPLTSAENQGRKANNHNSGDNKGNVVSKINAFGIHGATTLATNQATARLTEKSANLSRWLNFKSGKKSLIDSNSTTDGLGDVKQKILVSSL